MLLLNNILTICQFIAPTEKLERAPGSFVFEDRSWEM